MCVGGGGGGGGGVQGREKKMQERNPPQDWKLEIGVEGSFCESLWVYTQPL